MTNRNIAWVESKCKSVTKTKAKRCFLKPIVITAVCREAIAKERGKHKGRKKAAVADFAVHYGRYMARRER